MANDDKFLEEILVKMRDIQKEQNLANQTHGMDETDRHYVKVWDDLIKDTEARLGENNGYEKTI